MGNLEQALDLGQGVYTQAEIDAIPSSLSKVASNVLMSGNLALASSAVTKSNANITYTGNGSSQNITTGIGSVDFTVASNGSGYYHDRTAGDCIVKNDAGTAIESGSAVVNVSKVHIKSRSLAYNNQNFDGIRGAGNTIFTNATSAEGLNLNKLSSFNSNSISIGTDGNVNQSSATYILHQTLYTHIKWGLTNQGKRYLTAYNPVTREVMTMYQGSGIAGHQIPNALGIKLDYLELKSLSYTDDWRVSLLNDGDMLQLNDTDSLNSGARYANRIDDYIELDEWTDWNTVDESYISYGFANSETKIITQYQGTGASGNFIETLDVNGVAKRPRRVIIKRTDAISDWFVADTERGEDITLKLNTSGIEISDPTIMDINTNGYTIQNSYDSLNASGGQYIAIVEFDTTSSNDDTYFDLPTDDTNLNVTVGKLPYTDGRDTTNGAYNVFTQSYTGSVDFSTCPDGIHYVALDSNNAPKFYESVAIGSYEKEAADDNRLVFNTDDGKWYTTTGGELVTNGTFDSDVSGWTSTGSTFVYESGAMRCTRVSENVCKTTLLNSLIEGITYTISFQISDISNTAGYPYFTIGSTLLGSFTGTSNGNYSYTFTADTTTNEINLLAGGASGLSFLIDNISLYKVASTLDTALTTPISFIDDKPYQVASGTPMDRLVDYPNIPKNVMESSYVDGDLEVSGEVKGKNQCTAWVNFDGTTTPPTIRDSFNVKDVVRINTGLFDIYFKEDMDNSNYTLSGEAYDNGTIHRGNTDVSKLRILTRNIQASAATFNPSEVSVQIFGGK